MITTTANRILKVDHAGEFGAVNIYRGQILVGVLFARGYVPVLREFLQHERQHLATFSTLLKARGIPRCKSFWFCGIGGFTLGFLTALLGKHAVMTCTAAVEEVVLQHLKSQIRILSDAGDQEGLAAVRSIIADETEHHDSGVAGSGGFLYRPIHAVISAATKFVIWLGITL